MKFTSNFNKFEYETNIRRTLDLAVDSFNKVAEKYFAYSLAAHNTTKEDNLFLHIQHTIDAHMALNALIEIQQVCQNVVTKYDECCKPDGGLVEHKKKFLKKLKELIREASNDHKITVEVDGETIVNSDD